jgi:hypothetical protein
MYLCSTNKLSFFGNNTSSGGLSSYMCVFYPKRKEKSWLNDESISNHRRVLVKSAPNTIFRKKL